MTDVTPSRRERRRTALVHHSVRDGIGQDEADHGVAERLSSSQQLGGERGAVREAGDHDPFAALVDDGPPDDLLRFGEARRRFVLPHAASVGEFGVRCRVDPPRRSTRGCNGRKPRSALPGRYTVQLTGSRLVDAAASASERDESDRTQPTSTNVLRRITRNNALRWARRVDVSPHRARSDPRTGVSARIPATGPLPLSRPHGSSADHQAADESFDARVVKVAEDDNLDRCTALLPSELVPRSRWCADENRNTGS